MSLVISVNESIRVPGGNQLKRRQDETLFRVQSHLLIQTNFDLIAVPFAVTIYAGIHVLDILSKICLIDVCKCLRFLH